ncbi:MAG: 50S ribosomal protein L35 [Oscillospiraceae bacterium]
MLAKRTTKRKRQLRKGNYADSTNVAQIKRMIPYA